jgi:hypothetical protein
MSDLSTGKVQREERVWRAKSALRPEEVNIVLLQFSSNSNRRLEREGALGWAQPHCYCVARDFTGTVLTVMSGPM